MKISLVGYMGSGKSSIGQLLAHRFSLPFLDMDEEIEKTAGRSISESILHNGELYFRKLERQVLMSLIDREAFVLSTGGGTPCYYDNMNILNQKTCSVYLQYSVIQLYQRLEGYQANRPLIAHLKGDGLKEYIGKHLFERAAFYEKAILPIQPAGKSNEDIVQEIKDFIYE